LNSSSTKTRKKNLCFNAKKADKGKKAPGFASGGNFPDESTWKTEESRGGMGKGEQNPCSPTSPKGHCWEGKKQGASTKKVNGIHPSNKRGERKGLSICRRELP